ncbi:protein kinase [Dactylosporangium sp. AC04546]|uniref:protein kinase domain-containing protein n=1 Tax=Dactylosporangium sp. AC04546 TaxID=2862460 RepID=UPI001EDEF3D8|nr:protein kinase [Dactylosporangium sp. AC04546]WVK84145.1 protein kinase [Dactylosporangium sp. AC04546]
MVGRLLSGRYELRSVLGRGGMAEVWLAVDRRLGRRVAVKTLHDEGGADPSLPERFEREGRTVARLSHPNIVTVYDLGIDDGTRYLVMELVEGHSLADELAKGPLDPRRAVHIAEQVCDALTAAHDAGVVHRDVKPANILIGDEGRVKVCDFGIARITDRALTALTAPATVIGTSSYMAPEQILGKPVDARTDLYALGCVFYAMLTGRPPFVAGTPVQTAWQQVHQAAVPVAARRPGLPPRLAALVDALLAKSPTDRPASAAQVRAALAGGAGRAATAVLAHATRPPAPEAEAPVRGRAAVRPATRSLPVLGNPPTKAARRRGRSAGIAVAALGATTVAAAVFAFGTLQGRSDHPGAAPTAADTTQSLPSADTSSAAPSDTPTDEPSDTTSDPTAAALDAARAAVQAQTGDGGLDSGTARELNRRLDSLDRNLDRGNADRAAAELAGLLRRLDQLHQDGTLTSTGYTAVLTPIDQLAANLPGGQVQPR